MLMLDLDTKAGQRKLRARYAAGATYAELRSELRTSNDRIRRILGDTVRAPGRVPFEGLDLVRARRLARNVANQTMSVADFAVGMDVSRPTAYKLLAHLGVR